MSLFESCVLGIIGGMPRSKNDSAVAVVQGPYINGVTPKLIEQILQQNPNMLVICTTFIPESDEVYSFLSDSEINWIHTGNLVFIFLLPPSKEEYPNFWASPERNLERLTSFTGLQYAHFTAKSEYTLNFRSDGTSAVPNIDKYINSIKETRLNPREESVESIKYLMKGRIVIPSYCREWIFGHTTDLMRFFEMRGGLTCWDNGKAFLIKDTTDIWMNDLRIEALDTDELIERYFIIEDYIII